MVKNLITTIQMNLCCLIPASLEISTYFTWIFFIKIFAIKLHISIEKQSADVLPYKMDKAMKI